MQGHALPAGDRLHHAPRAHPRHDAPGAGQGGRRSALHAVLPSHRQRGEREERMVDGSTQGGYTKRILDLCFILGYKLETIGLM